MVGGLGQAVGLGIALVGQECDKQLPEEVAQGRDAWLTAGGIIHAAYSTWPEPTALIISALLRTGIDQAPRDPDASLLEQATAPPCRALASPHRHSPTHPTAPLQRRV